jgi:hypothetical protein
MTFPLDVRLDFCGSIWLYYLVSGDLSRHSGGRPALGRLGIAAPKVRREVPEIRLVLFGDD